jgi:hypothetical protein
LKYESCQGARELRQNLTQGTFEQGSYFVRAVYAAAKVVETTKVLRFLQKFSPPDIRLSYNLTTEKNPSVPFDVPPTTVCLRLGIGDTNTEGYVVVTLQYQNVLDKLAAHSPLANSVMESYASPSATTSSTGPASASRVSASIDDLAALTRSTTLPPPFPLDMFYGTVAASSPSSEEYKNLLARSPPAQPLPATREDFAVSDVRFYLGPAWRTEPSSPFTSTTALTSSTVMDCPFALDHPPCVDDVEVVKQNMTSASSTSVHNTSGVLQSVVFNEPPAVGANSDAVNTVVKFCSIPADEAEDLVMRARLTDPSLAGPDLVAKAIRLFFEQSGQNLPAFA